MTDRTEMVLKRIGRVALAAAGVAFAVAVARVASTPTTRSRPGRPASLDGCEPLGVVPDAPLCTPLLRASPMPGRGSRRSHGARGDEQVASRSQKLRNQGGGPTGRVIPPAGSTPVRSPPGGKELRLASHRYADRRPWSPPG